MAWINSSRTEPARLFFTAALTSLVCQCRCQRGVSLAEIAMTLAIMGVLSAVALPNFSAMQGQYQRRGATRSVFIDLHRIRTAAVTEKNEYRFRLLDTHRYELHDDVNNNGTIDEGEAVTTHDVHVDNPNVTLTASATVTFLPNGQRLNPGTATFTTTVADGASQQVRVNSAGRIHIH